MDEKKLSNLMKLEAVAVFAALRAQADSPRWWYFRQCRALQRPVRINQSLSPYRASLFFDYLCCGIECQVYIEREPHIECLGDNVWHINLSGIEGKAHAQTLHKQLKGLQDEGYYIPNGNENLERQMNFSLGLYGACLMQIDLQMPRHQPPLASILHVLDVLEEANERLSPPLHELFEAQNARLQAQHDDEDNPDIIMGDWQTWK